MMVEMGTDRVHHAFWQYMDPRAPSLRAGQPVRDRSSTTTTSTSIARSASCSTCCPDDAHVIVVSDHGAKCMEGGHRAQRVARSSRATSSSRSTPNRPCRLEGLQDRLGEDHRLGLGRLLRPALPERQGARAAGPDRGIRDYEATRDKLIAELEALGDPQGRPIGTRVLKPERLYHRPSGARRRPTCSSTSATSAGGRWAPSARGQIHTFENDTGPDDANHAENGLLIARRPRHPRSGPRRGHAAHGRQPDRHEAVRPADPAGLSGTRHRGGVPCVLTVARAAIEESTP